VRIAFWVNRMSAARQKRRSMITRDTSYCSATEIVDPATLSEC
jgi:hypothetical protein